MKLYKIRAWAALFENNRSRTVKELSWVPIPNRHDGENFSQIMVNKNGAEIYAAWVLILQVASRCQPRGTLLRDNQKPHTPASLSIKTRAPEKWFVLALDFLENNTDWLEIDANWQDDVGQVRQACQAGDEEGKGTEGTEGKGNSAPLPSANLQAVFDGWNVSAQTSGLPQCLIISDKRRRQIQGRLRDDFFSANWKTALGKFSESPFCKVTHDRGWSASFDWFISPDAVAKIMEGKYDNRPNKNNKPNSQYGSRQVADRNAGTLNDPSDYRGITSC